ncbi:ribose-5-phosphate isomerase A [Halogeometricum borinquense DSM 11551]|uniref:Ribose-5-phosphate isomerase A n=1 Tax=Halogeometricum borinquense (strain ATCC 700274 / DSM 11551 / JCM 10706 / KCTC 4070 / PR3) TaxID=469382 RepID=E4NRI2_HALBP|nr:ribose-5-phosphate isomerase RpiA [Halogeometricum borinquense]ADQ65658.1 ribose-5-phosphate isomerase [Halogeometricum borinquense DSM 11551]ELY26989.1 ribose-5-phosphate isomerase A [Halogeometricum borinquense DSM 11551]
MKTTGGTDDQKRRAAERAADLVETGATVGLGTGSTAAFAIRALGRAVEDGLDIRGVPTSFASRELAREEGIPLVAVDEVETIDVAIDGADQLDGDLNLIKGGGAAHAREKIVDAMADRFVVVADPSKVTETLERAVPLEVLPDARTAAAARVSELDGEATLRRAERKDGPVVTDNGNLVLDCEFGQISDPESLAADLSATPGVVEHGLFVGLADEAYIGTDDGVDVQS